MQLYVIKPCYNELSKIFFSFIAFLLLFIVCSPPGSSPFFPFCSSTTSGAAFPHSYSYQMKGSVVGNCWMLMSNGHVSRERMKSRKIITLSSVIVPDAKKSEHRKREKTTRQKFMVYYLINSLKSFFRRAFSFFLVAVAFNCVSVHDPLGKLGRDNTLCCHKVSRFSGSFVAFWTISGWSFIMEFTLFIAWQNHCMARVEENVELQAIFEKASRVRPISDEEICDNLCWERDKHSGHYFCDYVLSGLKREMRYFRTWSAEVEKKLLPDKKRISLYSAQWSGIAFPPTPPSSVL